MASESHRVFLGVQHLPYPGRAPHLSSIEHVWDMIKRELIFLATIIAELRQRVQDAWESLSQDDIRQLYDRLHARIHAFFAAREGYTVY